MGRKRTTRLVPALLFLAALGGCSWYYESQASKSVDQFSLDFPTLIRDKIQNNDALASELDAARQSRLGAAAKTDAMIASVYPVDDNAFGRFVKDHTAAADHTALMDALAASAGDGLNVSLFKIEALQAQADALASANAAWNAAGQVTLSPEQKQAIVQELVEAEKKDEAPDLNGPALLDWLVSEPRASKFPEIKGAYDHAAGVYTTRFKAAYNTEIDDAIALFRYFRKMGLRDQDLAPAWQKSLADFSGAIKDAAPKSPHYPRLKAELARYRKLAEKHQDLPKLSIGYSAKIKKGAHGAMVSAVQERMSYEGYYSGPVDGQFDDVTEAALIAFQRTHQVVDDGIIGRGTIDAMNVPFGERVVQIRLALEKHRQSLTRWENYYVRVNIPEFMVEVVDNGQILRRHKVIVGNRLALNHTPEFQATIKKVVYNPAWYMTSRIFKLEEFPKWEKDEEYFKKHGYVAKFNKGRHPHRRVSTAGARQRAGAGQDSVSQPARSVHARYADQISVQPDEPGVFARVHPPAQPARHGGVLVEARRQPQGGRRSRIFWRPARRRKSTFRSRFPFSSNTTPFRPTTTGGRCLWTTSTNATWKPWPRSKTSAERRLRKSP
ncbi:MAG: peptidoglycan-binding protein [Deltaproteobacteria bacterium]|nr:peptidoglycan-binding protein [Deltaproteobacteria bacterium]